MSYQGSPDDVIGVANFSHPVIRLVIDFLDLRPLGVVQPIAISFDEYEDWKQATVLARLPGRSPEEALSLTIKVEKTESSSATGSNLEYRVADPIELVSHQKGEAYKVVYRYGYVPSDSGDFIVHYDTLPEIVDRLMSFSQEGRKTWLKLSPKNIDVVDIP